MVREAYHRDLHKLREEILNMGSLVGKAIGDSVLSLKNRDVEMAQKVIGMDNEIDALDHSIEENCMRLLALQQPMARDLRLIISVLKMAIDLERMGDLAVNIAERALELNEEPILKPYIDIPKMRSIAQGMTRNALDAFVRKDKQLATDVIMRDDEVDDLKHLVLQELAFFMVQDPKTVTRAMKISFVAQYLERIADHATNIAEMVIYLVEGKIIRHTIPAAEK